MRVVFRCDPALVGRLPEPHAPTLPDWVRTMPRTAASDLHPAPVRTVKQCPPFIDAMTHGFVIPLACDVHVRRGTLSWDWDLPPPAAGHHPARRSASTPPRRWRAHRSAAATRWS